MELGEGGGKEGERERTYATKSTGRKSRIQSREK